MSVLSNPSIKEQLTENLKKALDKLGDSAYAESSILLEYPREKNHGDYTTTIALKLAKIKQENPLNIAKIIQKNLADQSFLDHTEIVAPGFINFYLTD